MTAIREPQFVVDAQGKPVAAMVDIQQYEALTEMGVALHNAQQALVDAIVSMTKAQDQRGVIPTDEAFVQGFLAAIDEAFRGVNNEHTQAVFRALREAAQNLLTEKVLAASSRAMESSQQTLEAFARHQRERQERFDALDSVAPSANKRAGSIIDRLIPIQSSGWPKDSEFSREDIYNDDDY